MVEDNKYDKTYFVYKGTSFNDKTLTSCNERVEMIKKIIEDDGTWEEKHNQKVTYSDLSIFSVINDYLDGLIEISLKHRFAANLRRKPYTTRIINIFPKTLKENLLKVPKTNPKRETWFLKRSAYTSCGGLEVYPINAFNLRKMVGAIIDDLEKEIEIKAPYVLDKGIKPLLIDGRKVDFRIYVVVSYHENQLHLYMYREGIIRFAVGTFDKDSTDPTIQLTNTTFGKQSTDDISVLTELFGPEHELFDEFFPKMKEVTADVFDTVSEKFKVKENKQGVLFLGLDFLISEDRELFLLEVNSRPAVYGEDNPLRQLLHKDLEDRLMPDYFYVSIDAITRGEHIIEDFEGFDYIDTIDY